MPLVLTFCILLVVYHFLSFIDRMWPDFTYMILLGFVIASNSSRIIQNYSPFALKSTVNCCFQCCKFGSFFAIINYTVVILIYCYIQIGFNESVLNWFSVPCNFGKSGYGFKVSVLVEIMESSWLYSSSDNYLFPSLALVAALWQTT